MLSDQRYMDRPTYLGQSRRPPRAGRGLGITLFVLGVALAIPGLTIVSLCGPWSHDFCLAEPYREVGGLVGGAGLTLMLLGPLLIYTRWQFAQNLGICPSCGSEARPDTKFCTRCGRRLR